MSLRPLKIAVVAGEASSDMLGAALINDLTALNEHLQIIAVGGLKMQATKAEIIEDNEVFAVMGLAEVLKDLPRLMKKKRQIVDKIAAFKADVFIGIDSPDLNFSIAKSLQKHQIPVVHYVSPSVWAWRPKRIFKMQQFIDCLLTLFPFETEIYQPTSIEATFVGHPLAARIPVKINSNEAKEELAINNKKVLALLPGSRNREINTLMPIFIAAVKQMNLTDEWQVFSSNVSPDKVAKVDAIAAAHEFKINWVDDTTALLRAADFALVGSGTVALEAMLCKTPMVVAYKISAITWWIVKTFNMMKMPYYSLPNVLHGDFLVPEVMQHDLTIDNLSQNCLQIINREDQHQLLQTFEQIHLSLLPEQPNQAAQTVLSFMESRC